ILACAWLASPASAAFDSAVNALGFGDSDERVAAINEIVLSGHARAGVVLEALAAGDLQTAGKRVLIVQGDKATDAVTGENVTPLPAERDDVSVNNRLRGAVQGALAALKLTSDDTGVRLAAAKELAGADESMLPLM